MLDIARTYAPGALDHRVVALPDDPLPEADAIVSTGHALSYLPSRDLLEEAKRLQVKLIVACSIVAIGQDPYSD